MQREPLDAGLRAPAAAADDAAFAVVTRQDTVSALVVRSLIRFVERSGVAAGPLLRAADLTAAELDQEEVRIPRANVYALWELALQLTRDPALGLHWAEALGQTAFVPVSHLLAHAATLRQGLASLAQFHRLLADQPGHRLVEQGDRATLWLARLEGESLRMRQFSAEITLAGFFRLLRYFGHTGSVRVGFEYPAPAHHAEYARVFEGAPLFSQPFTGIVFERTLLDAPAPHRDADMLETLAALAERRLLHITQRTPFALLVREHLMKNGGRQHADMEATARALGLSERSLRRRLSAEGKTYGELANEALASVAKHLLGARGLSIQETAYELGFADASTFHRAFKRWTGTTPNAFRAAQLAERGSRA